jgi:hypothetical protein
MLREPQHERKIINDFKPYPFVLSHVEGLQKSFSAALDDWSLRLFRRRDHAVQIHQPLIAQRRLDIAVQFLATNQVDL